MNFTPGQQQKDDRLMLIGDYRAFYYGLLVSPGCVISAVPRSIQSFHTANLRPAAQGDCQRFLTVEGPVSGFRRRPGKESAGSQFTQAALQDGCYGSGLCVRMSNTMIRGAS